MSEAEFIAHLATVRPLLWHYARRLGRRWRVPAEDLVQQALLAVWATRGKMAGHPAPSRWFAQAARWVMLRHARDERRRGAVALGELADALSTADPAPDEFDALLARLDPAAADLVRGRFAAGRTFDELAADAGITPAGVRHRLAVALDCLRAALGG